MPLPSTLHNTYMDPIANFREAANTLWGCEANLQRLQSVDLLLHYSSAPTLIPY